MGHCGLWDLLDLCTRSVQFCVHVHLHIPCVQTHKHTCACIGIRRSMLLQRHIQTVHRTQKHKTQKQKLTHTSGTCKSMSLMLVHRHGWGSRTSGHAELTEETLGTFLVGQGCSAPSRSRLQMSCQHSLKMCRNGPVRGAQGGHTVSP